MNSLTRKLYGEFAQLGIEVLDTQVSRGSAHVKIHCRYQGHRFIYVTSLNIREADRGTTNMLADLRRIQRAIRTGNLTILEKFKVQRDDPRTI